MLNSILKTRVYQRNAALMAAMVAFTVLASLLEVVSLGTFMPIIHSLIGGADLATGSVVISTITAWVKGNESQAGLSLLFGLFLVTNVVRILCIVVRDYTKTKLNFKIRTEAQNDFFQKYVRADIGYFTHRRHGEMLNNTMALPSELAIFFLIPPKAFVDVIHVVAVGLFLIDLSWQVFVVVSVVGLVLGVGLALFNRKVLVRIGRQAISSQAQQNSLVNEMLAGIREVKAYRVGRMMTDKFHHLGENFFRGKLRAAFIGGLPSRFIELFFFGGLGAAGLLASMSDPATLKQLLPLATVYVFAVFRMLPAFYQLLDAYGTFHTTWPAFEKYIAAMEEASESPDKGKVEAMTPRRDIVFAGVSFGYLPGKEVLSKLDLVIPANKTVAIVGGSGAGKSTLVDLLLGFQSPWNGEILVDGCDLATFKRDSWLRQVGYVSQSPFIFNDTAKANVLMGEVEDTQRLERVWEASSANEFLGRLAQGECTMLGERGLSLSGGQKQRICIARSLYRDPALLILDEATSSLDSVTEGRITNTLRAEAGKRTVLVLAHRLATIREADLIYVLGEGRVLESGDFESLMARQGAFAQLYKAGT